MANRTDGRRLDYLPTSPFTNNGTTGRRSHYLASCLSCRRPSVDGQFRQLSARDVGGITQVGGTFLGSARFAEFREESGRSWRFATSPDTASTVWW
jgi:hypothetical protein